MSDLAPHVIVIASTFVLAGFVKGVIGMGLPTIAMGLLSVFMAPAQAAALMVVPSLITNVWQMAAGPRFRQVARRLWPMMAAICIGTWAGADLLTTDAEGRSTAALGAALIAYAIISLRPIRAEAVQRLRNWEPWMSPVMGAATGVVTAATGVLVIPAVPYLQALGLEKEELVQALGLSFTVSTLALAAALAWGGIFHAPVATASLLALAPAVLGMVLGQWVRLRISAPTFRVCFFLGLLGLGLHLLVRGLGLSV